jgi:hypothetical protein
MVDASEPRHRTRPLLQVRAKTNEALTVADQELFWRQLRETVNPSKPGILGHDLIGRAVDKQQFVLSAFPDEDSRWISGQDREVRRDVDQKRGRDAETDVARMTVPLIPDDNAEGVSSRGSFGHSCSYETPPV